MSDTAALSDFQATASRIEADLDALALRLRSMAAHLHAVRAVGMLHAAVREIGAAIVEEQLRPAAAPAADLPLTVEVISPGADRADALVASIPPDVTALTDRAAAMRLGVSYDAVGSRIVGEVFRRGGWRQNGHGWWFRSDCSADSVVASALGR
ncbi:hypothetical protein [uncultured Sphingomonas sp.]|uniref:hypothetical protein n=1 Tax=uncultured Sphingomonas sp. TaxID=158754 RepID=UPI0035CC74C7